MTLVTVGLLGSMARSDNHLAGRDDNQPTKLTGSSGALRVYAEYLNHRIPETLSLPWPKGISTLGFAYTDNGSLELDCGNAFKLPMWDVR